MEAKSKAAEAAEIAGEILKLTNRIPPRIQHSAGVVEVNQFKTIAIKARAAAEKHSTLETLRTLYAQLLPYYSAGV